MEGRSRRRGFSVSREVPLTSALPVVIKLVTTETKVRRISLKKGMLKVK